MVAIIHSGQSFRRAVHYNENKVNEDKAECLAAINYLKDVDDLTVQQKINRLQKQAALNEKIKVNCVHISLNFDSSEELSVEKMQAITQTYMEKIGFGGQPYLIYQHTDAGHPHVHIVTTSIKSDGKRISLHNLGRDKSEPARKQIEQEFGLIAAGGKKVRETYMLQPVKINYGKTETKRALAFVVNNVINQYKFTSLEEFNAVLKIYNEEYTGSLISITAPNACSTAATWEKRTVRKEFWRDVRENKRNGHPLFRNSRKSNPRRSHDRDYSCSTNGIWHTPALNHLHQN